MTEDLLPISSVPRSRINCLACGEVYEFRRLRGRQPTFCRSCAYQRVLDNNKRYREKRKIWVVEDVSKSRDR